MGYMETMEKHEISPLFLLMFLELFLVFLRLLQHYSFRRIGKYSNSVHKKERGKFPTLEELNLFQLFVINNNYTIAMHH